MWYGQVLTYILCHSLDTDLYMHENWSHKLWHYFLKSKYMKWHLWTPLFVLLKYQEINHCFIRHLVFQIFLMPKFLILNSMPSYCDISFAKLHHQVIWWKIYWYEREFLKINKTSSMYSISHYKYWCYWNGWLGGIKLHVIGVVSVVCFYISWHLYRYDQWHAWMSKNYHSVYSVSCS